MNLEEREQGLLRLVEAYRESECRSLLEAAHQEAASLVARVYRDERARLHQRVLAERSGARERIQAARAERDTRQRASVERASVQILAFAWPRLQQALAARWSDPLERRPWVRGLVDQARRVLPRGVWTLRHAPSWPEPERQALARTLTLELGAEPRLIADDKISAGLAIETAGGVLDGTLEGLLKDRARVEARLLALLWELTEP